MAAGKSAAHIRTVRVELECSARAHEGTVPVCCPWRMGRSCPHLPRQAENHLRSESGVVAARGDAGQASGGLTRCQQRCPAALAAVNHRTLSLTVLRYPEPACLPQFNTLLGLALAATPVESPPATDNDPLTPRNGVVFTDTWQTTAIGYGANATGGGNAPPVTVTTESQLASAVSGSTPKVVYVSGTIHLTYIPQVAKLICRQF